MTRGDPFKGDPEFGTNPWSGVLDGALAHSLGFTPEIATTRQAARERVL